MYSDLRKFICEDNVEAVSRLVSASDFDMERFIYLNGQPLHFLASELNAFKVLSHLLSKGFSPCKKYSGYIPLHIACVHGSYECTLLLLDAYKDGVHVQCGYGNIATHYICETIPDLTSDRRVNIIKALLNAGSDINAVNMHGLSTLTYCMMINDRSTAYFLLDNGAKLIVGNHSVFTVPEWVHEFIARREAIRTSIAAWILVAYPSPTRRIIGKDMIRLVAQEIWLIRLKYLDNKSRS